MERQVVMRTSAILALAAAILAPPAVEVVAQRRKSEKKATQPDSSSLSKTLTVHQRVLAGLRTQIADLTAKVDSLHSKLNALAASHDQTRKGVSTILQTAKDPAANHPLEYTVKSVELGRVPAYLNEMGKTGWRLSHTEEYETTAPDGKPGRATRVYMERYRPAPAAKPKP
jgi:septal ring factor EnvC (AmiA/AmiB activator)